MSKKNPTLNETWKLCLSMWRWIAKQKKAGCSRNANDLKEVWLKKHSFSEIDNDCFFCHYDFYKDDDCRACPGVEVDSDFSCYNKDYHYRRSPIAFYNKLVALNRKRKKKKK